MTSREDLVRTLGFAISQWQDSVEDFDSAVGEIYELSGPERRCLSMVSYGPQSASVIAKAVNLTPAAVTTLIDRLEKRGFVQRQSDANDRRKVMVAAATKTDALIQRAYLPIFEAGAALLENYSITEMKLILKFMNEVTTMQTDQSERLRRSISS
ncbi:MarR family transcriptional regulator [Phyllobacterium sp. YR531]|uniref:MarR family transcriptional regulator n=1 Tax=Phyllobacterium sp. YR531 TaxID=1144343 RepID=UPI00026F758F|nr:MarR family transcriptional regulator [Phyllobacterium sp. YR531]EJN02075.1 transcriptional regulator [Phyllobacterium sp. YR531]